MSVDILIKSFERFDILIYCVENIRKYYYKENILIADDSYSNTAKLENSLAKYNNIQFFKLEPGSGLSFGRNFLLSKSKTDYFLLLDNDFIIKENTIENFLKISHESKATIVGGLLWDINDKHPRNYCGYFDIYEEKIRINFFDTKTISKKYINNLSYYYCRLCQNFFLGKKKDFDEYQIKWDNNLKLMEHEDFFIRFPRNLKIVETPDIYVKHFPIYPNNNSINEDIKNYLKHRHNKENINKVIKKYNLNGWFKTRNIRNILL